MKYLYNMLKKSLHLIFALKVYYRIGGIAFVSKRLWNFLKRKKRWYMQKSVTPELYYHYWIKKIERDYIIEPITSNKVIYIMIDNSIKNSKYLNLTKDSLEKQYYQNFTVKILEEYSVETITSYIKEIPDDSFFMLISSGDILRRNSLSKFIQELSDQIEFPYAYSDNDIFDCDDNTRYNPEAKPNYSKYYLNEYNYIGRSVMFEVEFIKRRLESLTINESPTNIDELIYILTKSNAGLHIPRFLISYTVDHKRNILPQNLEIAITPKISIIIPNKNRKEILETCIESILEKTTYTNYDILIIEHDSDQKEVHEYYDSLKERIKNIKILPYSESFNFAKMNNLAVRETDGEYLLFLNNDTEIITPNWIENMLYWASKDDVGPVGAKLYYPNGTIQHAGVVIGLGQFAGHIMCHRPGNDNGYMNRLVTTQEYVCVTAACLMVSRKKFNLVNGFDENLPSDFNDVDFCLKLYDQNLVSIYTPKVELKHYESLSRGKSPEKISEYNRDVQYMMKRWSKYYRNDPYFNKQLDYDIADFILKL